MVFYLIGLGLGDVDDITVRGLKAARSCTRIYLEAYTSILCYGLDKSALEDAFGKEVIEADRELVEQQSDVILAGADQENVAMLVVGDPFGATTHTDFVLRCKEKNIPVKVVHNTTIMSAVGCCGLQLYSFGETVSIVMWTDNWQPDSYYDRIKANLQRGLHTLCLLDIKVKEQSVENLMKKRKIYEPPRYMTCAEAAAQLISIAERKKALGEEPAYTADSMCVGLARVGWEDQRIVYCSLRQMAETDMGLPLHCLCIPGTVHHMEMDMLNTFRL
uniref:diphthine methyl ester synthase n=1 Tax=Steinernema glaseri TaxID=37863 RepID=A0A1I8AV88_9BILA